MDISSLTIDEFLSRLASSDPIPGGGSLAALAGAMAAAMLSMVCNLTIGRPRYAEVETEVRAILSDSSRLQVALSGLATADTEVYLSVRDAYRLPKGSDDERAVRAEAIEQAMHRATETPVKSAEAARAVLDLAPKAAAITNPTALGDVAVAARLAQAASRGAADQARLNLAALSDGDFAAAMQARLDQVLREDDALVAQALALVDSRATSG